MDDIRRTCDVTSCSKPALYECPRCSIPYCSVPCYRAHSEQCVQEFGDDAMHHLRGVKATPEERRRFNNLLERLRNDVDSAMFLDADSADFDSTHKAEPARDENIIHHSDRLNELGSGDDDCCQYPDDDDDDDDDDDSSQESDSDSDDGSEHSDAEIEGDDAASLLTSLMSEMDDSGKDALFTVLHKSLESESHREAGETPQAEKQRRGKRSAKRERPKRSSKPAKNTNDASTGDETTDDLLQLAEEMDAFELSYEEILSRLPENLARDFETRLREGRVQDLVTPCTPWWAPHTQTPQTQAHEGHTADGRNGEYVNNTDAQQPTQTQELPRLPEEKDMVLSVAKARGRAHPSLIHNAVDIIIAYTYVMHTLNFDWSTQKHTAARTMYETSAVLQADVRHTDANTACTSAMTMLAKHGASHDLALACASDAALLMAGGSDWITRALFECQRIFGEVSREESHRAGRVLQAAYFKLAFFVAWALGEGSDSFRKVSRSILSFVATRQHEELTIARRAVRSLDVKTRFVDDC